MKQQILKDIGGTLELKYYENGIQIVPASANITIFNNNGSEKVAQVAVTNIDAVGTMTYNILPAVVDVIAENWKAEWDFVISGDTKYQTQLFDIVNQVLINPVLDDDVIERAPFVNELNYRDIQTADSGTVNTIVSIELNEEDGYWANGRVLITAGTNEGEDRKVISFVKSTNTLTVDKNFTSAIDATSKFTVVRSFVKEIEQAYKIVENDLRNKGVRINRVLDSSQVFELILNKSIELISGNYSRDPVDIWSARKENFMDMYNSLLKVSKFDYDRDQSGNVDSEETADSATQIQGER